MIYFKKILINILFPKKCIGCEEFGEILCLSCIEKIKNQKKNENYISINWIYFSLNYKNKILKKLLFLLKYNHVKDAGEILGKIIHDDFFIFLNKQISNFDENIKNIILIPIPISKKRLIERDYNQSEIILKSIIKNIEDKENINLNTKMYIDLLKKDKHTIKFAETDKAEDRENLIKDVFSINEIYNKEFLKNKIIILIDDITTTGSTFYEARKTLIKAGIQKENIFAYAVAH